MKHGMVAALILALGLMGLPLVPVTAQATLGPAFASVPAEISTAYNADTGILITRDIVVSGRNVDFGIGVSTGGSGSYNSRFLSGPGGATLEYRLVDPDADGTIITDLDAPAGQRHLIYAGFRGNQEQPFPFALMSTSGQYPPAGTYTDTVMVRLYGSNPALAPALEEVPMLISVTVPPFVRLSVVGRGEPFDPDANSAHLDFGELEQGRHEEVDLVVMSDVNYTLAVSSPNSGVMVLTGAGPTHGSSIPYIMRVNGVQRSLATGMVEIGSGTPTAGGGDRYELYFEIGQVRDATSGEYEDNLTVTVTAQ